MAKAILHSVRAGEVFIVWDDDTPAATITVDRWANPDLWTEHEAAESAFYIHRLIVDHAYSGHGLGAELIDWAGTHAARASATWLRLDAWTTNAALQQSYLDQGFTQLRTVALNHNPSGALFQRPAIQRPTPSLSAPPDNALAL
jgi:GNAT superfamily N-acetyltransferase